jgi:hypothetical protein
VKWLLAFVLLLCTLPLQAQQITVTGNATDSDGQQWIGGTYQITLVRPGGLPNFYCTSTGTNFPASFGGTLDGTGSFSVQLTTTACIVPTGSLWKFQICPNVTNAACGVIEIPVTASGSISSQINAAILAPRVTGGPGIHAYNDTEVAAFSPNTYFNVISQQNRCYSTSWSVCTGGGGGGATLPFPGIVYGTSPSGGTVATSNQVQTAIGSGVYDVSGAAATAQTNAENFTSASYAPLASPTFTGTVTAPNLTLSEITGSTQCLEVSSSGVVSGTGGACGSGSGAVNSVTNSDGTLTISPTSGSVIASLALGHANTWTGNQDFSGSTQIKLPVRAGYTSAAAGELGYDSTNLNWHVQLASGDYFMALFPVASPPTDGDCVKFHEIGAWWEILDAGAPCGSGSGAVASVTNSDGTLTISPTTGAVVGSLALGHANTWTGAQTFAALNATSIGATTPGTGAFTTLTATTVAAGSSPPTACGSATGCLGLNDGSTAGTPTSGQSYIRADSTTNTLRASVNGGAEGLLAGPSTQNLGALTVTSNAATLATAGYFFTSASVALNHTSTTTVTLSGVTLPNTYVSLYASQDSTGSNTITLAGCPTGNFLYSSGAGLVSSTTPPLTAPLSGANNIAITYTGANCIVVVQ